MSPFFPDELLAPALHFFSVDRGKRGSARRGGKSIRFYETMCYVLWLESVVNPIYDRKEQLTIESNFAHYFHFRIRNSAKRRKAQFQVVQE